MQELFEQAPIPKAYFKLAFPVVLGMVVSMIYNLADTFFCFADSKYRSRRRCFTMYTAIFPSSRNWRYFRLRW